MQVDPNANVEPRPVGRPRKVQPEVAPNVEEPIDQLRERLISEWVTYILERAGKSGNAVARAESIRNSDSFCLWVGEMPEAPLRKWAIDRDRDDARIDAANKIRLEAGRDAVCAVYANINGRSRRVTLTELQSNSGYQKLSPAHQFMAKHFVENFQRQNADGLWVLSNRAA